MDSSHVDVNDRFEVLYWCRKLHCSEHQLREAVSQVGNLPSNVEAYIRQRVYALEHIHIAPGRRPS
jgi:hypothetical protein